MSDEKPPSESSRSPFPSDIFHPDGFEFAPTLGSVGTPAQRGVPETQSEERPLCLRLIHRYFVNGKTHEHALLLPHDLLGGRYRIVNADGTEPHGQLRAQGSPADHEMLTAIAVGGGTFGLVARARDSRGPDRAIKFLVDRDLVHTQETDLTTRAPFKHVLPVIDYGSTWAQFAGSSATTTAFLVSHYIDGPTLQHYFAGLFAQRAQILARHEFRRRLHDQVLSLIDDIFAGLEELSTAGVVHMDIKPTNMLLFPRPASGDIGSRVDGNAASHVSSDSTPQQRLFIIDLGAGKHVGSLKDDRTPFVASPVYFPTHWVALEIEGLHGSRALSCNGGMLRQHWRALDVYCAGRTLEEFFLDRHKRQSRDFDTMPLHPADEAAKEQFWREIFSQDFELIEGIILRMLGDGSPTDCQPSVIRATFQTIAPYHSRNVLASGPLVDAHPTRRIRVGRSLVTISPPFDQCIDHPQFQRLRRINQLSTLSLIFPDATHSRFTHSIQTFHLAKRFVTALYRTSTFRLVFERADVNHVLAAALLHDVGQYAFAHAIEDLRMIADHRSALGDPIDWLSCVPYDHDRMRAVLSTHSAAASSLALILEDHGLKPEAVIQLTQKGPKEPSASAALHIGRDLIAGIIDVDRVSYLMHDSERTGVPYGMGVDVESLAEALAIRWEHSERAKWGLGIEEAGISAVEAVLLSTYWMYRNVYWHHGNRGMMAAIKFVFRRLLQRSAMDKPRGSGITFDEYLQLVEGASDWSALRVLHERWELASSAIKAESGASVASPLASLVEGRRLGYRRILSIRWDDARRHLFIGAARRVTPEREDELLRLIGAALPGRHARDGDVLIDYPIKKRFQSMDDTPTTSAETFDLHDPYPLWVRRRRKLSKTHERWSLLRDESPLVRGLGATEDQGSRRIRVYLSRELLDYDDVRRDQDQGGAVRIESLVTASIQAWREEDERLGRSSKPR